MSSEQGGHNRSYLTCNEKSCQKCTIAGLLHPPECFVLFRRNQACVSDKIVFLLLTFLAINQDILYIKKINLDIKTVTIKSLTHQIKRR